MPAIRGVAGDGGFETDFDFVRRAVRQRPFQSGDVRREIFGVHDSRPRLEADRRVAGQTRKSVPALVRPDDRAVGAVHVDDVGNVVGELLKLGKLRDALVRRALLQDAGRRLVSDAENSGRAVLVRNGTHRKRKVALFALAVTYQTHIEIFRERRFAGAGDAPQDGLEFGPDLGHVFVRRASERLRMAIADDRSVRRVVEDPQVVAPVERGRQPRSEAHIDRGAHAERKAGVCSGKCEPLRMRRGKACRTVRDT